MNAVVGGTTSELTGGKFANGTVTGAFVHLFNAEGGVIPTVEEEALHDESILFIPFEIFINGIFKAFDYSKSFFDGTYYSNKVLAQMKKGDWHSFPEEIKLFENSGTIRTFKGGDGQIYHQLDIKGGYMNLSSTDKSPKFRYPMNLLSSF